MSLQLKGTREMLAFLEAFPARLQKGAVRSALTAAAKPIRDAARTNAAHASGKMAKAIKTGSPRVNQDGTVSIKVRLAGEHAFVGLFQEFGVRPHLITAGDADVSTRALNKRARKSGVLAKMDNGLVRVGGYDYMAGPRGSRSGAEGEVLKIKDSFIRGAVLHPGHAAHPFMRPALDGKAQEAIRAFGVRLASYLKDRTGFSAPALIEVDE